MEDLFLKIFNMSITASWIALAVMLLRLPLKKAPKWIMGVLWAFVALRLILPISLESVLSLIPSAQTLPADFTYSPAPAINSGIPAVNSAVNPVISESLAPAPGASANPTQILSFIASVIWLIGAAGMLLYMLISYIALKIKVRESVSLEKDVRICDRIPSPFILGVIFPRIYLPSNLGEENMRYVMEHERTHIRRGDHLWKPLGFVLLSVYWFNPILWAAYVLMCKDIELACDEKVIRNLGEDSKKAYSEALINCSAPRRLVSACPLAFGEVGVKERIKRVLNYRKPAFWIIILAIVSCTVVAVCFLTNPKRQVTIASLYAQADQPDGESDGLPKTSQIFDKVLDVWITDSAESALYGDQDAYHIDSAMLEDYISDVKSIKLGADLKDADPYTVGSEPDYYIVVNSQFNDQFTHEMALCFSKDFTEFWPETVTGKPGRVYSVQEPEKVKRLFSWVMLSIKTAYDDDGKVITDGMLFPDDLNHYVESPVWTDAKLFNALKSCKFDKSTEIRNFKGFGKLKQQMKITNLCGDDILIGNDGSGAILTYNGRAFKIDYPDFDAMLKETCSFKYPPTACVISGPPEDTAPQQTTIFGRYYAAKNTIAQSLVLSSIQRPEFAPVFELYNSRYDSKAQNVIPVEGLMLISRDTGERRDLGDAEEISLTKENFDELFSNSMQCEDGISAEYFWVYTHKTYSFSTDTEFHYIIWTRKSEIYYLNGSISREGKKTLLSGYRLTDVTPGPNSLGGYIDHAFFDVDGDGEQETCILSYGPTSGLYTIMFTVRQGDNYEYNTIFCPQFTYLRDPTDFEGGYNLYSNYRFGIGEKGYVITATGDEVVNPKPLVLEISIRDGQIVLTAEDGTEMQVWGNGFSSDETDGLNPAPIVDIQGTAPEDDEPIADDSAVELQRFMAKVPIGEVDTSTNVTDISDWFDTSAGKMQSVRFSMPEYWQQGADGTSASQNGEQMMKIVAVYKTEEQPLVDELVAKLTESSGENKLTIVDNSGDNKRSFRYMLELSEQDVGSSVPSQRQYYFVERKGYCFCLRFDVNRYSNTELNESLLPYFYDNIGGALEPTEFEHVYIRQYSRLNAARNDFENVSEDDRVFITLNVPADWNWNRGTADMEGIEMFSVGRIYPAAEDEGFDILKNDSRDISEPELGAKYSYKLRRTLDGGEALIYLLKRDGLCAELIFNVNENFDEDKCERLVETFEMMDMNNHADEG